MNRTVYIPPFFRGDGMESAVCIVDVTEVSGLMVLRDATSLHVTIEGRKYSVFDPMFVVKPTLWLMAQSIVAAVKVRQNCGRPVVEKALSPDSVSAPLYAIVSKVSKLLPTDYFSLVFTKEPNSLSGYGWRVTRHESNPLTPEWVANLETYQ